MLLKEVLDRLYDTYNFEERLRHDPIEFPHRYSDPVDIEVVGFIASQFAYGRIGLFKPVIEKILNLCGRRPHDFLFNFDLKKDSRYLKGISYRFSSEEDVLCFVYMVSVMLKRWGSLRQAFYHYYRNDHRDIGHALSGFVSSFLDIDTSPVYGKDIRPRGLRHFFPLPEGGSACKRLNLFLRWMVRRRDIDFGIWKRVQPSKLIIPLDTHIARIARCLKLTGRKTSDWKTAVEITESLRMLDPEDPLRYDFVLCHHGVSGQCLGERAPHICSRCILYDINHR
jgi:uncharacterized protein (TIGR02757 family)